EELPQERADVLRRGDPPPLRLLAHPAHERGGDGRAEVGHHEALLELFQQGLVDGTAEAEQLRDVRVEDVAGALEALLDAVGERAEEAHDCGGAAPEGSTSWRMTAPRPPRGGSRSPFSVSSRPPALPTDRTKTRPAVNSRTVPDSRTSSTGAP